MNKTKETIIPSYSFLINYLKGKGWRQGVDDWVDKITTFNESYKDNIHNATKVKRQEKKLKAYRLVSNYTIKVVEKAIQEMTEEIKNNSPFKNLFMERKLELENAIKIIKDDTTL